MGCKLYFLLKEQEKDCGESSQFESSMGRGFSTGILTLIFNFNFKM